MDKKEAWVISGELYLKRFRFPEWDYTGSEIWFEDKKVGVVTRTDLTKYAVAGCNIWFELDDDIDFKTEVHLRRLFELARTKAFVMRLLIARPNRIYLENKEG